MVINVLLSLNKVKNYDYNITQANNSYYNLDNQDDLSYDQTRITVFHVIKRVEFNMVNMFMYKNREELKIKEDLDRYL